MCGDSGRTLSPLRGAWLGDGRALGKWLFTSVMWVLLPGVPRGYRQAGMDGSRREGGKCNGVQGCGQSLPTPSPSKGQLTPWGPKEYTSWHTKPSLGRGQQRTGEQLGPTS